MPNDASYVTSTINPTSDLKAYTVEFWIRPAATITGDAFMLVILEPRLSTYYTVVS